MSTDYSAYKDGENEILTDSRRRLEIHLKLEKEKVWIDDDGGVHYSTYPERLTEEQIVEIGVNILGPAFYFTDDEDALVQKIKDAFTKQGFTYKFDK